MRKAFIGLLVCLIVLPGCFSDPATTQFTAAETSLTKTEKATPPLKTNKTEEIIIVTPKNYVEPLPVSR